MRLQEVQQHPDARAELDPRLLERLGGRMMSVAAMIGKLWRARSRLYQRQFLQPNTHFSACFKIYKIDKLLHRSDLKNSPKNHFFCKILQLFFCKICKKK